MRESDIFHTLFQQAPDAIVLADTGGIIRRWNPSAERIFGHSPHEAIGRSLDIIIPERFRDAHWRGYRRALTEGRTKYVGESLPTRSVRKDGDTIYVELTFAIIHGENAEVLRALAHARDISERWEREREQRKRLEDLERTARETG